MSTFCGLSTAAGRISVCRWETCKELCSARKWNLKLFFFEKKGFVRNIDFGCTNTVESIEAWGKTWYPCTSSRNLNTHFGIHSRMSCVHVDFLKISAVSKHRYFTFHTKDGLKVAGWTRDMTRLYRVILSVLDPRKCEYLKDYSLHFEHAYMTTYLASWKACRY